MLLSPLLPEIFPIEKVPLLQFSGKLEYLLHYPYGCIEQTVSTAFPLIYLEDLARQLTPEMFGKGKPSPAVFVQHGIRRVATMQLVDGSFTLWPGGTLPHPWGTVYATHFLIEAKRAGYEVPDYMLTNALKYLASHTQAKQEYGSDELQETAYALYVLARASKAANSSASTPAMSAPSSPASRSRSSASPASRT